MVPNDKRELKASDNPGIDYALLKSNLAMSVEERLRRHQEALDLVVELANAGQGLGYRFESTPEDSLRE